MRRTREDAERTREALLEAALKVFSQQGYASVRLEDVASAAGVTRGAIYHHFGGKAELFAALVEAASQQGAGVVERAIQEGTDFIDIARRVLTYGLRLLEEDSTYRRTMALFLFQIGGSPELEAFKQQRVEQGRAQVETIAGFFRMGLAQGALRPDLDPMVAARSFIAYQNGLTMLWLSDPNLVPLADAPALAETFLRGIAAR